ncbi:hypothetical protein FJY70_02550 [candidate division WOR-3 bacterium]|nr:hypothetical protein [candidate division WOR-3 bacterium]
MSRAFAIVVCLWVLVGAAGAQAELHRLGFVSSDLSQVAPEHEVKSIPVAPGAKSFWDLPRVDLTDEMPPTGDQGAQGSCASYAITYYHRTQLEYRERGWDLNDRNHQFSPAFTYNQVNGGGDNGSSFENNMPLVCEQGVASLADCPYNDRDCTSWPSESAYARALPFRTKDWAWFRTNDTTGINMIKQLLVNGSTSCLAIWVWGNFDAIGNHNFMYCVADKSGSSRGGHLVTFVGYDDTLTTRDGTGAFRMVNSWGPAWGQQGYFWMSYEAVMDHDLSQRAVGYLVDTVGYVPKLLARVGIEHPTRDRVAIEFTVGKRWNAMWIKDFRSWRNARQDQPFPANKMVFDLTDAASFITGGATDSIYFVTWDCRRDNRTGTVNSASVQYLDWGTMFASSSTPVPIPDNGDAVAAGHRIRRLDRDASVTWIFGPTGIVEPGSPYVPSVEVRNYGASAASFPVLLNIGSDYADTVQVTGLAPTQVETLAFSPWLVPPRCTALVHGATALTGDEYQENDACSTLTWARFRDMALIRVVAPADTVDSGAVVRPQVYVRNNGTQMDYVNATFRIPDEGYVRSSRVTVPAHSEQSITFATWIPKLLGSHAYSCTLDLADDMDPSNDTASGLVLVRKGTGVAEERLASARFRLEPPQPSVFGQSVVISFALPKTQSVALAVYDATGALVRRLAQGTRPAGLSSLVWDAKDESGRTVPSGAYFCRLEAGSHRAVASLLKL